MNTGCGKRNLVRTEGEKLLPIGINVERLKKAQALRVRLTDIGFPWESELKVERFVVQGDIQISY